jgi:hypothetical protein
LTQSKEARMSSDGIQILEGPGGVGGERGPGVSQQQLDGKTVTTLAAQFCPVPLVKGMMVTVSQANRPNSQ